MKEQHRFNQELYTLGKNICFDIVNNSEVKVSEEVNSTQNEPLSGQEISEALKDLKSGKTPGKDGLSPELLKVFWRLLKEPFMNMLNAAYQTGAPDSDMCQGVINLIPQASKDQCFLKNLRTIVA